MDFRAYLDSFNDTFSGDWNAYKYVGRAEDFHTYAGFNRAINFGFKIAASSGVELEVLYNKLNLFASSTAPTYVNDSFQRGTFMAVTIGDYLQDHHTYAICRSQPLLAMKTDDGDDVIYLPWRYNTALERTYPGFMTDYNKANRNTYW